MVCVQAGSTPSVQSAIPVPCRRLAASPSSFPSDPAPDPAPEPEQAFPKAAETVPNLCVFASSDRLASETPRLLVTSVSLQVKPSQ
jgi:hypothetical protein